MILPFAPVGTANLKSAPVLSARILARGEISIPSADAFTGAATASAAGAIAGAASAAASAGAAAGSSSSPAGLNSSTLSPSLPITQTFKRHSTSSPSSKKIASIVPSTFDSSSKVDLSVS